MSSSPRYDPTGSPALPAEYSRVFRAVLGANRNKGGLVLGQQELLAVDRHLTGAGENNPMLGAVVVHLHREGTAGFTVMRLTLKRGVWTTTSQRPQGGR